MMKKTLCLLLLLICSLALFACGAEAPVAQQPTNDDVVVNAPQAPLTAVMRNIKEVATSAGIPLSADDAAFFLLVADSQPNKIVTVTNTTDKSTRINYEGKYWTFIESDGSYRFDYDYEKASTIGEADQSKVEFEGTVLYKNGLFSTDDGANWTGGLPDVSILDVKLNLDVANLGSYRITKNGTTLRAVVDAAAAEKILGVDINTDGEVTIEVVTNGTRLWKISVEYENAVASVSIETSYTYLAEMDYTH